MGLATAVIFVPGLAGHTVNPVPAGPRCDLLGEQPCRWANDAGRWSVSLEIVEPPENQGDGGQGSEYRLLVDAPGQPSRFLAVLRGESMYMGEYPVPLRSEPGNRYSAHFTAPLCSTGAMTWRVDLQEGQDRIEGVPLQLVFESRSH